MGPGSVGRMQLNDSAGFSLIELIVVLAILAAATALALPRTGGALQGASLDSAALQLASALRLARADVIRSSRDRTLTLDMNQKAYWSDHEPKRKPLDRRIAVSVRDESFEWEGTARRIRFRPDGSATGGVISLADGSNLAEVRIDWLTGVTSIKLGR